MSEPVAIFLPGRPFLLNAERSRHWREHRAHTADVRLEASYLWHPAARKGELERVKVEVYPTYANGRLADTGACMPTVKAMLDGAVDAGLLPDDTPDVVTYLGFHRPVIDHERGTGVMVILEEIGEDSPWAT